MLLDQGQVNCAARSTIATVEQELGVKVEKIFVIGSYAVQSAHEDSDLDFLVELDRQYKRKFPRWTEIMRVQYKLPPKVHVIFGTEQAQQRTGRPYKEITKEMLDATTHRSTSKST